MPFGQPGFGQQQQKLPSMFANMMGKQGGQQQGPRMQGPQGMNQRLGSMGGGPVGAPPPPNPGMMMGQMGRQMGGQAPPNPGIGPSQGFMQSPAALGFLQNYIQRQQPQPAPNLPPMQGPPLQDIQQQQQAMAGPPEPLPSGDPMNQRLGNIQGLQGQMGGRLDVMPRGPMNQGPMIQNPNQMGGGAAQNAMMQRRRMMMGGGIGPSFAPQQPQQPDQGMKPWSVG